MLPMSQIPPRYSSAMQIQQRSWAARVHMNSNAIMLMFSAGMYTTLTMTTFC